VGILVGSWWDVSQVQLTRVECLPTKDISFERRRWNRNIGKLTLFIDNVKFILERTVCLVTKIKVNLYRVCLHIPGILIDGIIHLSYYVISNYPSNRYKQAFLHLLQCQVAV
jgi:hypothetical protein